MTFQAILWDLDGVLADTFELHYQTWATAFAGHGLPFDRQLYHGAFGMNNKDLVAVVLGRPAEAGFVAQVTEQKERAFQQAAPGLVRSFPGVQAWLEEARALGLQQAVASSAPQGNIEVLVDALGFRPYFAALVSGFAIPGKPDPAVFLEAARRLGIHPKDCLVIEDSLPGLEAARRAGMRCLAVANTNPPEALGGADLVAVSLAEVSLERVVVDIPPRFT